MKKLINSPFPSFYPHFLAFLHSNDFFLKYPLVNPKEIALKNAKSLKTDLFDHDLLSRIKLSPVVFFFQKFSGFLTDFFVFKKNSSLLQGVPFPTYT